MFITKTVTGITLSERARFLDPAGAISALDHDASGWSVSSLPPGEPQLLERVVKSQLLTVDELDAPVMILSYARELRR